VSALRWRAVARVLIVGGGCRGRALAGQLTASGHAVRATTRGEPGRAAIEATGAECWIGTPDRLATLRGALENVTVACWMLASASGSPEQLQALHGSRLELFMTQAIDTTVRGVVYDAGGGGAVAPEVLAGGERIVRSLAARNVIPLQVLDADVRDERWLVSARAAVGALLGES
jgi:nucleoside-diphosphate-sugar epimerase